MSSFELYTRAEKTPDMFYVALETRISMTTADAFKTPRVLSENKLRFSSNAPINMADVVPGLEKSPNAIEKAKKLLQNGCGCTRGSKGGPCSREFKEETVIFNLNNCLELTAGELDLVILANIQVFTRDDGIWGQKKQKS